MEDMAENYINEVESDVRNLRWDHERANKFIEALKIYEERGDTINAQKMKWKAYLFYPQFRRMGNNQKVGVDLSREALDYYEECSEKTKNPIHKARYCDIIWEIRKNHLFARAAIDAYFDCISIYLSNDWQHEMADSLQRSAELALALSDDELIKRVKEKILDTMSNLVDSQIAAVHPRCKQRGMIRTAAKVVRNQKASSVHNLLFLQACPVFRCNSL